MWGFIRKFGVKYCDLPTMIWNVSFLLRAVSINIDSRNKNRIPVITYIITLSAACSYIYVYVVSVIWFVFWYCQETGDMLSAVLVLSSGITSEIGVSKIVYLVSYQKAVRKAVEGFLICDSLVVTKSRFNDNLLKTLRVVKKRAMIYWSAIVANGTAYIIKALATPGRHLMDDNFIFYGLKDIMYDSPFYEMALLINIFSIYFVSYMTSNIGAFFIILVGYVEAQMLALSQELTNIWDDAEKHYKDNIVALSNPIKENKSNIINNFVKRHLEDIARIHIININLLRKVEDIFRGAFAIEFVLLIVGLIAELLGGLEKTYIQLPCTLMIVGTDCLIGQRVMDASEVFEKAVYDCKWENFQVANRKIVLFILVNAQKTLQVSAGGVTKLNFVCFMSVIKSTYSAYTTLRSTMK